MSKEGERSVNARFQNFPKLRDSQAINKPAPSIHNIPYSPYNQYLQPEQREKIKKIGRIGILLRRNPVKFHIAGLIIGLSIFYSRPIYDIFFREYPADAPTFSFK